jgi:hypothetical protein
MRLCTREQHQSLLNEHPDNKDAAVAYRALPGLADITPQNVAYWRRIFIDNGGKLATTDKAMMNERKLRVPQPGDDIGTLPDLSKTYHCILHIPDQHYPYQHPDLIPFIKAVLAAFPVDLVVNAGDEADYHALSFHDSDPNLDSAGVELERAREGLSQLHRIAPQQLVCASNHGSMVLRKAKHHGIPVQAIRPYREILFPKHKAPGWSWADEWIVQTPLGPVMFRHSSSNPAGDAAHERCNLMVGHNHSKFAVEYCASSDYLYWGATGGCLIDKESYAFAYGKLHTKKPIIGCTVILEGRPMLIPMVLNKRGRWIGRL